MCDKDEDGNCGSLGKTDYKPQCFDSNCTADDETASGDQCLATTDDARDCENPNFDPTSRAPTARFPPTYVARCCRNRRATTAR